MTDSNRLVENKKKKCIDINSLTLINSIVMDVKSHKYNASITQKYQFIQF